MRGPLPQQVLTRGTDAQWQAAADAALGRCHDAVVVVRDGVVLYAGPAGEAPGMAGLPGQVTVRSAGGRLVTPGLIDGHTHLIWAGDRSHEFELRNLGAGYQAIQAAGGGIGSTVRATGAASDQALMVAMRGRLQAALRHGTTLCEVKTGYGLLPEAELRLLRLIGETAAGQAVRVSPTFLCHIPPKELGGPETLERQQFVAALALAVKQAATSGAQAVDVYCDAGAFTRAETELLLRTGQAAGLLLRCHAEQFTHTGAAALAAQLGAASVEHLEQIDEAGISALAQAGTVANLLPGAALTLRLPWPDARRLVAAGVRVALATDNNPGSSRSESLPLMMSLGCTQLGLSCAEAFLAVTRQAAVALRTEAAGHLSPGARGDLVLWDTDTYRQVSQHLGADLVGTVWSGGRQVYSAGRAEAPAGQL